jgi:AbrB family looped-hinge helix DNA binding protein
LAQSVKIIEGGKLVIPAAMRRAMGVERGDTVVVELLPDGELRVRSLAAAVKRAQTLVRGFVRGEGSPVDELIAERRAEAERE